MMISPLSEIVVTTQDMIFMKNMLARRLKKQDRKKGKAVGKASSNNIPTSVPATSTNTMSNNPMPVFKTPSLPPAMHQNTPPSCSRESLAIMSTCTPTISTISSLNSNFATPTSTMPGSSSMIFGKTRASMKRAI